MISYHTFQDIINEISKSAPELADYLDQAQAKRPTLGHFAEHAEKNHIQLQWKHYVWWDLIERGEDIDPVIFLDAWIPGWQEKEGPFLIITDSSYSSGRTFKVSGNELLEFHIQYEKHSGDKNQRYLQGPADYVAFDTKELMVYLLMHEGYATCFSIGKSKVS